MKKKLLAVLILVATLASICLPAIGQADEIATAERATVTKTAVWTNADATEADIVIESSHSRGKDGKILFIGSLCASHGLTSSTVIDAINAAAIYADVDYKLLATNWGGSDKIKSNVNSLTGNASSYKESGSYSKEIYSIHGTLSKSGTLTSTAGAGKDIVTILSAEGSGHAVMYDIAEILAGTDLSQYGCIVLMFDGLQMGNQYLTPSQTQSQAMVDAAAKLKSFYASNSVLWLIPSLSTSDANATGYTTRYMYGDWVFGCLNDSNLQNSYFNIKAMMYLLEPESSTLKNSVEKIGTETVKEDYKSNKDSSTTKSVDFKNTYYATLTDHNGKLAAQTTFINRMQADEDSRIWVEYGNSTAVSTFIKDRLLNIFQTVKVDDVVVDTFGTIASVTGEYQDSNGTWQTISDGSSFGYTLNQKTVTATFDTSNGTNGLNTTKVRLTIHVALDDSGKTAFQTAGATGLNTNDGVAKVTYTYDSDVSQQTATSPTLVRYEKTVQYQYVGDVVPSGSTAPASATKLFASRAKDVLGLTAEAQTVEVAAAQTAAGYTFDGWYKTYDPTTGALSDKVSGTISLDGSSPDTTTLYGKWSLAVSATKEVSKSTATAGDELTYTITVKNDSDSDITVPTVTDTLPTSLTEIAAQNSGTVDGQTVTWSNVSVSANSTTELKVTAKVKTDLTATETLKNKATATFDGKEIKTDEVSTEASPSTYTLTYEYVGTTQPSTASEILPASVTDIVYGTKKAAATQSVPAGYTFDGWYKTYNATTGALSDKVDSQLTITADTTLYGKWSLAVSATKEVSKSTATAGDELTYTITVKNGSNSDITVPSVTDTLSDNLENIQVTSYTDKAAVDGQTVTWSNVSIAAGQSASLTIKAAIKANLTETKTLENTAAVGFDGGAVTTNKVNTAVSPRNIRVLYKYVGDVPADKEVPFGTEGDSLVYGSSYTAQSAPSAEGYTFSGWFADANGTVLYTDGTTLTEDTTTLYGKWTLTKKVSAVKDVFFGVDESNNPVSVKGGTVTANSTLTYAITVTNDSAAAVSDVVVTDKVPAGLSYVTGSATEGGVYNAETNTVTWTLSSLGTGDAKTKTLRFNATIPEGITEYTTYTNTAVVKSVGGEEKNKETNSVTVTGKPLPKVYRLSKAWSDTWSSHSDTTVTLQVLGTVGESTVYNENYVLTAEKTYVDLQLDSVTAENAEITYTFRELDAEGKAIEDGELNNGYKVSYSTDGNSWLVTNTYRIVPEDLAFGKTADSTAAAGERFNYVLTVENTRAYETATNIVVEDVIPAGLKVVYDETTPMPASVTLTQEEGTERDICDWTIASLGAGEKVTLTIPVQVPETAEATEYANTAYILVVGETECKVPSGEKPVVTDVRSFTVSKTWEDSKESHDGVEVELYRGGTLYDTVTLNAGNSWKYSWSELPLYDSENSGYWKYTVKEKTALAGYDVSYNYIGGDYGNTGSTITNKIKEITVSYVFKGDLPADVSVPASETKEYGTSYEAASTDEITSRGYTFRGWYTDEDCTQPYTTTSVTQDTVLYGEWTRDEVTVSYEYTGDVPADAEAPEAQTIYRYQTPGTPTEPGAKAGYKFDGWFSDPECTTPYTPGETGSNITVYGHWSSVKVSYAFTGDVPEGAKLPDSEEHWEPGTTYIAQTDVGGAEHYRFDGWYTDEDCTEKFDEDGEAVTENLVLYGKWSRIAVYSVTYEYTGEIPDGVTPPEGERLEEGSVIRVADEPTAEGYTFDGWYLDSDFTTKYDPTQELLLEGNITLYGKWTKAVKPDDPTKTDDPTKSDDPAKSDDSGKTDDRTKTGDSAKTGDSNRLGLWIGLLAFGTIGLVTLKRRKKEM